MPPELSDRTRGWLRFIWDKATTPDDWSSTGEPHEWWDRNSTPPMCAFPRFDLGETSYILPVLCDQTPAWREVYTRIADELVGRHTTFWAAIDWVTLIGHDPHPDRYPPEWLTYLPESLRGRYDPPGWTANGVDPWGLQPDPIGADGNLFFRGFFNLLLSVYRYVSGDEKWERPFEVVGYRDRRFEWSHHEIAEFLNLQWKERPQGPHCENTKIWPYCLSAAGLGLHLYDGVTGSRFHGVYDEWVEYAKKHFMELDGLGNLRTFPFYYDPLEDALCSFRDPFVGLATLAIIPYLLPQNPEFGTFLYEQSATKLGWNNPDVPALNPLPDPRWLSIGLLAARDIGDLTTEKRLREVVDREFEPRWFGEEKDRFGWWFGLDEKYPRGQLSSLLMLSETGEPGAWSRVFRQPNLKKFNEPTIEGVDYPTLAIRQAWNDTDEGTLHVATVASAPSGRGRSTTFRVTQLPNPRQIGVLRDGSPFDGWRVLNDEEIEVETDVEDRSFEIRWRGAGMAEVAEGSSRNAATSGQTPSTTSTAPGGAPAQNYAPESPASCGCCSASATQA